MPLYEYRCDACGKMNLEVCSFAERPASLSCSCDGTARLAVPRVAPAVVTGRRGSREGVRVASTERTGFDTVYEDDKIVVHEKGHGLVLVYWACTSCDHTFDDVYEAKPAEPPPCPTCGAACREVLGVPEMDWFTKQYGATGGYYDRGLGVWVTSLQHRREVMAEQGLVEYGEVGDEVHEKYQHKLKLKAQKEDAEMREMFRSVETGPDAAELKRARDDGRVKDWSPWIEALGGLDER